MQYNATEAFISHDLNIRVWALIEIPHWYLIVKHIIAESVLFSFVWFFFIFIAPILKGHSAAVT